MSTMPPRKRRSYTAEYKVEAAHRVIDTDRTIAEAECLTYQGVFTVFGCRTGDSCRESEELVQETLLPGWTARNRYCPVRVSAPTTVAFTGLRTVVFGRLPTGSWTPLGTDDW